METTTPPGAPSRPPLLAVGTVVWLASEVMFFSGLFAAYFTLRAVSAGAWPPEGVELAAVRAGLFTLVLVASSATVHQAVRALRHGRAARFRWWMAITAAGGIVFLVNQALEWAEAGFAISSHTYGSAFFVLTGFHGLHVAGGVCAMVILLGRSAGGRLGPDELPSVEVVGTYWHFVDVVWVAMYATLFVLR